jgi:biopolymer transport protein ExbB
MTSQLFGNWICWAIVIVALFCYQQLWLHFLRWRSGSQEHDALDPRVDINVLIGAMPLLGLLGTIIGLLTCFTELATQTSDGSLFSQGVSDALLTTQLGLVCAIPGWLLHAYILSKQPKPPMVEFG